MNDSHIDNVNRFKKGMLEVGLSPPEIIVTDSQIHRFRQQDDTGTPCWYRYYPDGIAAGSFGCWRRDIKERWCSKLESSLSKAERKIFYQQMKQAQEEAKFERLKSQKEAAKLCQERWKNAQSPNPQHPYLARKKSCSYGLRQEASQLLVPIYNIKDELVNLQSINPEGRKLFSRDACKKGCFYKIGTNEEIIYLVEGYATGATIHEVTSHAVVVAFDAGNLLPVAKNLHIKYPASTIIIAADNDLAKENNVGLNKAKEVSKALSIDYVFPVFKEGQVGSDFNDLFQVSGSDEVDRQLLNVLSPEQKSIISEISQIDLFDGDKQKSASTLLIEIGSLFELFHDEGRSGYAIIRDGDIKQVVKLRSEEFKERLSHYYYLIKNKGVHNNALQDALNTLDAKAKFSNGCRKVFRRVGCQNDKIYIDLGSESRRVVEIDSFGWRILKESPVMFIRSKYSKSLPVPISGGKLDLLWQYINIREADRPLIFGWLVGAFKPEGPYPLLNINGMQGSGKSCLTRILRALVDPNTADTTNAPRDERDFAALGYNNWLMCLDNLSSVENWLSDALCRMSTGGAISGRRLYSDVEEVVYEIYRPAIINGIPELATRADLRERCITIELESLSEKERKSDVKLIKSFHADAPKILGAIFAFISSALKGRDKVRLERKPRLADFAEWVVAAEQGMNLEGQFLKVYFDNLKNSDEEASEVSVMVYALQVLLRSQVSWIGRITDLFNELNDLRDITDEMKRSKAWRDSALKMRNEIKRNISTLKVVGISVDFKFTRESGTGNRLMKIQRLENFVNELSQPSQLSQKPEILIKNNRLACDALEQNGMSAVSPSVSQKEMSESLMTVSR